MYPARTSSLWLRASASAGSSRSVRRNRWDRRVITVIQPSRPRPVAPPAGSLWRVRILLSPSEAKSVGGTGSPLDLGSLALPSLTDTRRTVADPLVGLCSDAPTAARSPVGLSERRGHEVAPDADLGASPTAPALSRYTGVLYDALDPGSFTAATRSRAEARLWIGSALFGLLAATDPIPHYPPSAATPPPGLRTPPSAWRPAPTAATTGWPDE